MDKSTICTMALRLMGQSDYVKDSPGYNACELFFSQALYELIAAHDWSFARRRKVLARDEGGQFIIPDDCLRIIELEGLKHWRVYGQRIRVEGDEEPDGDVVLVYTSSSMANRGEIPDGLPEFARALVVRLAAYICPSVANNPSLRINFEREAQEVLDRAMTHDTQQDNSNDQHPLEGLLNSSIVA